MVDSENQNSNLQTGNLVFTNQQVYGLIAHPGGGLVGIFFSFFLKNATYKMGLSFLNQKNPYLKNIIFGLEYEHFLIV